MNTNPSAKRVLCYGDSYTWGYIPASDHDRFPADMRWTGVVQTQLGSDFEIIEEGMNSRTLNSDDPRPHKEGRNGLTYLKPCLDSHDPLDLVILMLGTNELKDIYDIPSTEIALLVEKYIEIIITPRIQYANQLTKLLLLSPPILNLEVDYARERYTHSRERNLALAEDYRKLAEAHSCLFLNAAEIVTVGADGVHFDAENHKKLGEKIAEIIRENLWN